MKNAGTRQVPMNYRRSSRRALSKLGMGWWNPRSAQFYALQTRNGSLGGVSARSSNSRWSGNTGIPPTGYSTVSGRSRRSLGSCGSGRGYGAL